MTVVASPFDVLIGRDDDLNTIRELLGRYRLVTLVGTGGTGKTRLAREIAVGRGAAFVDLSAVDDEAFVPSATASALAAHHSPRSDAGAGVIDLLMAGAIELLVLDNLEQLPAAGGIVDGWLGQMPSLRILATSRVPLGVQGEAEYGVRGLALPTRADADGIEGSPAGELFLRRSRALGRLRVLSSRDAADVAELLRKLDGVPLAIELAAARTRVMTPGQILSRLDDPATLRGIGVDKARHDSLQAVVAWSVDLLSASERAALEALTIAPGSFDLELAEALAPDTDIVASLDALVRLGLAHEIGNVDDRARFRLPDTVRRFVAATAPMEQRGALERRLAGAVDGRVGELARPRGRDLLRGVVRWRADLESIFAVLAWAREHDPELGVRITTNGLRYVGGRDTVDAIVRAIEELIEAERTSDAARLDGLLALVRLITERDGPDKAASYVARGVELAQRLGDATAQMRLIAARLLRALNEGAGAEAALLERQILELAPKVGDPEVRASIGGALAQARLAAEGWQSETALGHQREALDAALEIDDLRLVLLESGNLAFLYLQRDAFKEASNVARNALAAWGDTAVVGLGVSYVPWLLSILGVALSQQPSTVAAALTAAARSVEIALQSGIDHHAAEAMLSAAVPAHAAGDDELAGKLIGYATRLKTEHDWLDLGAELGLVERLVSRGHRAGSSEIKLAVARAGEDVTSPAALLAGLQELARSGPASAADVVLRHGELTRREVEILALLAAGLTDSDIAGSLVISPKTVSVHISNAKAKLGVNSRVELALQAREMGLYGSTD